MDKNEAKEKIDYLLREAKACRGAALDLTLKAEAFEEKASAMLLEYELPTGD